MRVDAERLAVTLDRFAKEARIRSEALNEGTKCASLPPKRALMIAWQIGIADGEAKAYESVAKGLRLAKEEAA